MKTEMEKCLAGEWYDCHNQVFLDLKTRTHKLLMKYNSLPYEDKEEKHSLLKKMLGSIGMKVSVASPFICDYGCNIHIGKINEKLLISSFSYRSNNNQYRKLPFILFPVLAGCHLEFLFKV